MKPTKHSSHKRQPRTHLFHFTKREELMMAHAVALAETFMESYGKGEKVYMVDMRHYQN